MRIEGKKRTASKLGFARTHTIRREINIYNLLYNIQTSLYNIPNSIEATANFDFQPWDYAAMESAKDELRDVETDAEQLRRRWMMILLQLENLQIAPILGPLWKLQIDSTDAICERFLNFSCKQKIHSQYRRGNATRFSQRFLQFINWSQKVWWCFLWEMREKREISVIFCYDERCVCANCD